MKERALKFTVKIAYDCDEGKGCTKQLEKGTYEEAKRLLEGLASKTVLVSGYFHRMLVSIEVYDENGSELDLKKELDGEWSWLSSEYSTNDKFEASDLPSMCIEMVEAVHHGAEWWKQRKTAELKSRIESLEKELASAKAALAGMVGEAAVWQESLRSKLKGF